MADTSTNLSKIQRERLLDICSRIKNKEAVEVTEIAELEQFIKSMKYGLTFERHEEPVDAMLRTHIPVFKEFKEIINNPDSTDCNFLLEGDNLHSLKLLEKTHKGAIDVIYIDPPYNTLNDDFAYGDAMIDENDGFIHSKWLSFMKERLHIARKLLSSEGVIFISIDDREQAQLKLLCDEIFGEDNCLATICVELSKTQGMKVKSAQNGSIVKNHEYIHVYCKDINYACQNRRPLYDKSEAWDNHFNCILLPNKNNTFTKYEILDYIRDYHSDIYTLLGSLKLISNGKLSPKNIEKGILLNSEIENFFYRTIANCVYQQMACSIQVPDDILTLLKNNNIVAFDKYILEMTSGNKIRQYRNLAENLHDTDEYFSTYARSTIRGALWKGFYSDMMNVQKEGSIDFKNGKKPIRLMKQLIKWVNRNNAVVLDFFAGSGSTGHAVMDLNKEDGGHRRFILCTNNEVSAAKTLEYIQANGYMRDVKVSGKNKTIQAKIDKFFAENPQLYQNLMIDNNLEYETYGICQSITYPRLQTVITGIRPDGSKYSDGIKTNLKYFQTDMIDKTDDDLDELLYEASFYLAELENMAMIDDISICIANCDEDIDDIITNATEKLKEIFIADDVLLSSQQKDFFMRHNVSIKQIPNYYYKEM